MKLPSGPVSLQTQTGMLRWMRRCSDKNPCTTKTTTLPMNRLIKLLGCSCQTDQTKYRSSVALLRESFRTSCSIRYGSHSLSLSPPPENGCKNGVNKLKFGGGQFGSLHGGHFDPLCAVTPRFLRHWQFVAIFFLQYFMGPPYWRSPQPRQWPINTYTIMNDKTSTVHLPPDTYARVVLGRLTK